MPKIDNRYLAGLFDGEGCVGVYAQKGRGYCLRVQLVQTKTASSAPLFQSLREEFGGNVSESRSTSGRMKLNWQLASDNAVRLLEVLQKHLLLKTDQVRFAVAWQKQRPLVRRDALGRISSSRVEVQKLDAEVCALLKLLKKNDLVDVLRRRPNLAKIVRHLHRR